MNYEEAIRFIHSVEWQGSRPGLSRINELLSRLGHPEEGLKSVHVAGTNGKGSFCAMLESVLRHAGYRTGLFVSPYIEEFEERIQCNGHLIDREELAEIVSEVAPICRSMKDLPTEFEILTAIGFVYFKRKQVEVVVVECGMGGRLDSTNVIAEPLLSVITGIALDHVQFLGDTVEKIAVEKAGIIKAGRPVLYGGQDVAAGAVIAEKAVELGSPLTKKDFDAIHNVTCSLDGTVFDYKEHKAVHLPLIGCHQAENGASVLEAVAILRYEGLAISDEALREGLAAVQWKGRFEKLNDDPVVLFDGGHNEEGVKAAVRTVKACFGEEKLLVISGVMKDKDYDTIAASLASVADTVYTVTPANPRALPAEDYAKVIEDKGIAALPCPDFETAVGQAYARAKAEDLPLLCVGSLYAYGDFKKALATCQGEEAEDTAAAVDSKAVSKKRAKGLILAVAILFCVLLALNFIMDSGLIGKLLLGGGKEQEREPVFLFNPDYEEDIFEDEVYLDLNRYILYTDGALSIYLANENDFAATGEVATFFGEYFDAVIMGDHRRLNACFTEEYREEHGEMTRFTMQKLYDMEVVKLAEYIINEGTADQTTVYEFKVSYRIRRNNGTFRDDLESGVARPQIYQLYRLDRTEEILIQSISEYNYKN